MTIATYDQLKTALANWLHRDDLSARIPEFIAIGEASINRDLRLRDMEASETITMSTSNAYAELPTGYMEIISFVDDYGEELEPRDSAELAALAYSSGAGRPKFYRIGSRIDFERVSDSAYSFAMRYYKRLDIATDETNAVLTNHPDIYLFASLLPSAPFIKDDGRIAMWKSMLDVAIGAANWQAARSKTVLQTELTSSGYNILRG